MVAVIYVNPKLRGPELTAVLAEEIGHHLTSAGDSCIIPNGRAVDVSRSEYRAMVAAVDLVLPFDEVCDLLSLDWPLDEIAELYDVPLWFLATALRIWEQKGAINAMAKIGGILNE